MPFVRVTFSSFTFSSFASPSVLSPSVLSASPSVLSRHLQFFPGPVPEGRARHGTLASEQEENICQTFRTAVAYASWARLIRNTNPIPGAH